MPGLRGPTRTPIFLTQVALFFAAILAFAPLYALAVAAMNPSGEWALPGLWPGRCAPGALIGSVRAALPALISSAMIAIPVACLGVVICTLAAFILSVEEFLGRRLVRWAVVLAAAAAPVAYLMMTVRVAAAAGLWDTRAAVALFLAANPLVILILSAYMRRLPMEMIDAARLDGLSPLGILRRIVLPLIRRGVLLAGIVQFLAAWNAVSVPMLLIGSSSRRTVTVLAADLSRSAWAPVHEAAGAALWAALPALLLYLLFFRFLMREVNDWAGGDLPG